jgi:hypothetical protein
MQGSAEFCKTEIKKTLKNFKNIVLDRCNVHQKGILILISLIKRKKKKK